MKTTHCLVLRSGLIISLSLIALCVQAQKVIFEGVKRTKSTYLLKFIGWEKNIPTDSVSIAQAVQQIRNTRFFTEVKALLKAGDGDTSITFQCVEVHTALPIFELGATEGNKWIRVGLEDENGLGKGIRTILFYQYNDRHSFYLKQTYPFVFKKWSFSYLLKKWSILEPIERNGEKNIYNYTNLDAEVTMRYIFDINRHDVELGTGFMNELYELPVGDMQHTMADIYRAKRLILKGTHTLNRVNYATFYLNGWANKVHVYTTFSPFDQSVIGFISNETTYFKTFSSKGNFAMRSRLGISTNSNVFLAPFVSDNYLNIRGIGDRIDRGTASATLNIEYRQTVWENKTFGIQAVGFSDAGTWRKSKEKLSDMITSDNMKLFAGIGGRFIYKKAFDFDIRLDYGWSIKGEGNGLVFGLGQYF
jgi:outer membrane protein insertion porin family